MTGDLRERALRSRCTSFKRNSQGKTSQRACLSRSYHPTYAPRLGNSSSSNQTNLSLPLMSSAIFCGTTNRRSRYTQLSNHNQLVWGPRRCNRNRQPRAHSVCRQSSRRQQAPSKALPCNHKRRDHSPPTPLPSRRLLVPPPQGLLRSNRKPLGRLGTRRASQGRFSSKLLPRLLVGCPHLLRLRR